MRHFILLLLILVPSLALAAGPTFNYKPMYNTRNLPYKAPHGQAPEDDLKRVEERLMREHAPAPKPALTSEDIDTIIDKKNKELLDKIARLQRGGLNMAPSSDKKEEAEPESPFGKIGGLGNIGGIGAVGGAAAPTNLTTP